MTPPDDTVAHGIDCTCPECQQPTPAVKPGLTTAELHTLDILADAWTTFTKLDIEHPTSESAFAHAIHTAQTIIMARPTLRQLKQSTAQEAPDA